MQDKLNYYDFVPQLVPPKMNGTKLTYKIRMKNFVRLDGTCALYLEIYLSKRKRLPLNLAVPPDAFDINKQRIKNSYKYAKDYNLLIEKVLADLNTIEISYRLSNETMTLEKVVEDFKNPSLRINYNLFAMAVLEKTKDGLKHSTYVQQKGALAKIKAYKDPILFADIDEHFLVAFKNYLKKTLKNKPPTVESTIKNFKKYLRAANDRGIKTSLRYSDISISRSVGDFTFLMPDEINKLYSYFKSPFINHVWKDILQRYLFSCFTGIRFADIEAITNDNFIDGNLVFTASKTGKFSRIKLNNTALEIVSLPQVFNGTYSRKHINEELKNIARSLGITKRIYFHSSRHTFATNYLMSGGKIQNLQKLLGHSDIKTTMIYSHVVESLMDKEVGFMDAIIKEG